MQDRGWSTRRTRYRNLNGRRRSFPETRPRPLPSRERSRCASAWRRRDGKGKTVSIITGVKSPEVGKRALAKHLKDKLGSGGAVKGADIEIQGDPEGASGCASERNWGTGPSKARARFSTAVAGCRKPAPATAVTADWVTAGCGRRFSRSQRYCYCCCRMRLRC